MKKVEMIKLVDGDVVLGKLDLDDLKNETITIEKPMQLMLDPTQGGVGMIPFNAVYTQQELETCTIRSIDVMYPMSVHETFKEAYLKQTTGIDLSMPEIELGTE